MDKMLKKQVLEDLKTIPYGKITTYNILAKKHNTHPRTIAAILKSNTQQNIYPCYKVVKSNGELGGYNLGIDEKAKRLEKEGIRIINGKIKDFKNKIYHFNLHL